jgi:hypothetical protein
MFGLEILDVVIGLTFVFLLLSLLATAINEYLTAVMNLRGKELAHGLEQLLDDFDDKGAVKKALNGLTPSSLKKTLDTDSLTERFYNNHLIRPLATRRGPLFWFRNSPRLPSYIPARTFALALLDLLKISERDLKPQAGDSVQPSDRAKKDAEAALEKAKTAKDLAEDALTSAEIASTTTSQKVVDAEKALKDEASDRTTAQQKLNTAKTEAANAAAARRKAKAELAAAEETLKNATAAARTLAELSHVLKILQRESPQDVVEHLPDLHTLLSDPKGSDTTKLGVLNALTRTQTELQKLHDSVEVWFNHSMDRVSGAYKRTVQGWLFVIGLLIASCSNADTVDMWRRLSANDKVREGMAARAIASVGVLDSVVRPPTRTDTTTLVQSDTATRRQPPVPTPPVDTSGPRTALDSARLNYRTARARLDSLELKLGWTRENLQAIGVVDSIRARRDSLERVRRDSTGTAGEDRRIRLALARLRPRVDSANEQEKQILRDSISGLMEDSIADAAAAATARQRHWRDGLSRASLAAPVQHPVPFWTKVFGLLLTAIAISLGAPFWFDLLNKVISIRAAGRSPSEKPKSPEGDPKRLAEHTPM